MSARLNLREQLIRWTALGVFLAGFLGAVLASVLRLLEPQSHSLNLVLPELVALVCVGLFIYVLRRPQGLYAALWMGFAAAMSALVVVTWVFLLKGSGTEPVTLVDGLPPIAPLLLPVLMITVLFMRPRWVVTTIVAGWILVALPLLAYLITHPAELWTPRGMELVIMLGPAMIVSLILVPFFKGMESNVESLNYQNSVNKVLAERDPLTNLYNRRAGEKFLARLVDEADPNSGLIIFDIDFFKGINDTHGHSSGDEVLRAISDRCAARLRRDDIFVRWGGEEFLILIHGAPKNVVALVAEDLRDVIAGEPFELAGKVTASFGVTQLRLMDSVETVIQRVDEALYAAKRDGRNQVVEK